jgi:hypothetical protein
MRLAHLLVNGEDNVLSLTAIAWIITLTRESHL